MDFLKSLEIGGSGLSAQKLRMAVTAANLANAHTTRTAEGGPYRRKDVIFEAAPLNSSFREALMESIENGLATVKATQLVQDPRPYVTKYEPHHPDADEKGYIKLPNINVIEEMTNMMSAMRTYEANVAGIKATKEMALKALEIGR